MAAAKVQQKFGQGVDPSVTLDSAATTGNFIEVTVNQGDDTTAITFTVSDNKGNTYNTNATTLRSTGLNGTVIQKFYAYNITGGSSFQVSVNQTGSGEVIAVSAVEYSGVETTDPLDKTAEGASATPSNSPTSGSSGTLSQANELVTYAVGTRLNDIITTAGGSFSLIGTQTTTGEWGAQSALYQVVAATTAISGNGTLNSAGENWVTVLATYKAGGGAPPVGANVGVWASKANSFQGIGMRP